MVIAFPFSYEGRVVNSLSWMNSRKYLLAGSAIVFILLLAPKPRSWVKQLWLSVQGVNSIVYRSSSSSAKSIKMVRTNQAAGPLQVSTTNPRYFEDGSGNLVYLAGSHTWANFQDNDSTDPPTAFNYTAYLDFLQANNHNFFRLWRWEQAKWTSETPHDYWFDPMPYKRLGPGTGYDGKTKFNLDSLDQSYFDRMRQRIIAAGQRGIYVAVLFFNGWSVDKKGAYNYPFDGHPYNANNNVNGVDGDPNNNSEGSETELYTESLSYVAEVIALEEVYIRKVIDTVNDLDNVLYEICNEPHYGSTRWQYHIINYIKSYEVAKPKQHPVGMSVAWEPSGATTAANDSLFSSSADWIAPNGLDGYSTDPPPSDGSKVVIVDTDHIFGVGGNRIWVWKSFMRGLNPIFMDAYDGRAFGVGAPSGWDSSAAQWVSLRKNMGYTLTYANRIDLLHITPQNGLSSTGYCLAKATSSNGEYLVYRPGSSGAIMLDLSATSGTLNVEWFDPSTGDTVSGGTVQGSASRSFTAPFANDAILYVYSDPSLPVQLSTFTAKVLEGNAVRLSWSTQSEVNNYGFYVHRRSDNDQDFAKLPNSFIQGAGTSSSGQTYSFVDKTVKAGRHFYKLEQVDNDGTSRFSSVAEVEVMLKEFSLSQNYPNPFNPATTIIYDLPQELDVTLKVFNTLGQEVRTLVNERKKPGSYTVVWDGKDNRGSSLSSGIHISRLLAGVWVEVRKMVLLK